MSYTRFAIYYVPPEGTLASFGARWLGWDIISGTPVDQLPFPGLKQITKAPQKYGFHGTLKPPFRLQDGYSIATLQAAVAALSDSLAPAVAGGLQLRRLGQFLALVPTGDSAGLARVAQSCVTQLDHFRAPPSAAEHARRLAVGLTPSQADNLRTWGYPYVRADFQFHLTLTSKLAPAELDQWQAKLQQTLPILAPKFEIHEIALVGERHDGQFALIQRYALTG